MQKVVILQQPFFAISHYFNLMVKNLQFAVCDLYSSVAKQIEWKSLNDTSVFF